MILYGFKAIKSVNNYQNIQNNLRKHNANLVYGKYHSAKCDVVLEVISDLQIRYYGYVQ